MLQFEDQPQRRLAFTLPLLFLLFFLIIPLQSVLFLSFLRSERYKLIFDLSFDNYLAILLSWSYLKPLIRTFFMSSSITIAALLIALPVAYWLASPGRKHRLALILLLAAPFMIGLLVRVTALQLILAPGGLLEAVTSRLGFSLPLGLMYSDLGTFLGLLYIWTPFMVVALYLSFLQFDYRLVGCSRLYGASWSQALTKIILPLNRTGITCGCVLVFIPCLGSFVEPRFLGGPNGVLYGMLVEQQIAFATWPKAAALSFILLALSLSFLLASMKMVGPDAFRLVGLPWEEDEEQVS